MTYMYTVSSDGQSGFYLFVTSVYSISDGTYIIVHCMCLVDVFVVINDDGELSTDLSKSSEYNLLSCDQLIVTFVKVLSSQISIKHRGSGQC